jgi:ATP-dependent helicase/nuclease subunit B
LKIIFGLDLDGYQPLAASAAFDELICGPLGLLGVLELRLGLGSKSVSSAVRVAQYRDCLEQAASTSPRFYTASFSKDAFSAAKTLLAWRDELILAGWKDLGSPTQSARLRDFGDVERIASPSLSPGFGDRVRAVLGELERREPKLDSIEVVENQEELPLLLRQSLIKLGALFGCIDRIKLCALDHSRASQATSLQKPAAPIGTDLRKLQEALVSGVQQDPIKLAHDGSVIFVTAYSEVTLAQFAAQLFQRSRGQSLSATMIAQRGCPHLDTALRSLDEPILALSSHSPNRPVLQTLALALALRWKPLDPRDLLAFLVHPVSPMNDWFRVKLADVVAECPGVGGTKWNGAIQERQEFLKEKFASDPNVLRKMLKQSDEDLAKWITVERFDPLTGAPGKELAVTCAAIVRWAMTGAGDLLPALADQYAHLASHASDLAAILRSLSTVTRAQLDRLLDQIVGTGIRCNHAVAEAGHVHRLTAPGAFLEPADMVVWWDFRGLGSSQLTPWTSQEIEQLKEAGIELLPATTRYTRENLAALRPVLGAKKQLVFMCPRMLGNEPVPHHPLRDRIQSLIDGQLPMFDLDRHLADPVETSGLDSVVPVLDTLPRRPLPGIRRWWKLRNGQQLGQRDLESFTSAEKFIFNPSAWVFRYKAQLRAGRLFRSEITCGARQRGTLLHRLNELVFAPSSSIDWKTAPRKRVDQWLEDEWQKLLLAEGANLLSPGNRAVSEGLLDEGKRAIWSLIEYLRAASATKTTVSFSPAYAPFVGGKLHGIIDLLVENKVGRTAVIDLKYNGYQEKKDELANNLQLQLAIYGYLIAKGTAWPDSAFFILKRRALLAQHNRFFPDATIVLAKSTPSGLEECWKEFEALWRWRRGLLNQGWIECAVSGTDPLDSTGPVRNLMAPIEGWQLENAVDPFNDFNALTGWEENA